MRYIRAKQYAFVLFLAVGLICVAYLTAVAVSSNSENRIIAADITEVDELVIAHALDYASRRGLYTNGNPAMDRAMVEHVVSTTREEWDRFLGRSAPPEAAQFGIFANQPIAIIVIRGEVNWSKGPGLPNPNLATPMLYDNIYVMVDPQTGTPLGETSFAPGQPLPFYPEGTIAGGTAAQYISQPDGAAQPTTSIQIDDEIADHALEIAAQRGLILTGNAEQDRAMIDMTVSSTRAAWHALQSTEVSQEAVAAALDLSQPLIIIVFRGTVDWDKGPGLPFPENMSPPLLDNLYVAIDAVTGQRIGTSAFNPGVALPFYPEGTFAGGTPAQIIQPDGDVLPVPQS